jgi:hypothetical protein
MCQFPQQLSQEKKMNQKRIVVELQTALSKLCLPTLSQQLGVLASQKRRETKVSQPVTLDEARAIRRIRGKGKC